MAGPRIASNSSGSRWDGGTESAGTPSTRPRRQKQRRPRSPTASGLGWSRTPKPHGSPSKPSICAVTPCQRETCGFFRVLQSEIAVSQDNAIKKRGNPYRPVQQLDPVATAVDEHKQVTRKRVALQHLFRQADQPMEALPHVDGMTGQINPHLARNRQHDYPSPCPLRTFKTRRRQSPSKRTGTRTT